MAKTLEITITLTLKIVEYYCDNCDQDGISFYDKNAHQWLYYCICKEATQ